MASNTFKCLIYNELATNKVHNTLLVKEDDIREKITRYCKNLEAMHALGDVQRIKLN